MTMEILSFFFGNFWRWLGATIMMGVIFGGFRGMFAAIVARSIAKVSKRREP